MKENLHFKHSRLNYTNNQNQKSKKSYVRLAIVSIGIDVVAKTDGETYVVSIIKMYSFHCFLCCARKGRVVENI